MTAKSRRTPKVHWGYLVLTVFLCIVIYFGSLILYPAWRDVDEWVIVLLVSVVSATVQFVANIRTILEPNKDNKIEQSVAKNPTTLDGGNMKDKNCESISRRLDAARKILNSLELQALKYPDSELPARLQQDIDDKRKVVDELKVELSECEGGNHE